MKTLVMIGFVLMSSMVLGKAFAYGVMQTRNNVEVVLAGMSK